MIDLEKFIIGMALGLSIGFTLAIILLGSVYYNV